MYPRIEGEIAKLVKIESGWMAVVWDPEPPKPALPGQPPCSQQPVKFWKTYAFKTSREALAFLDSMLPSLAEP